jgi:hypothetical protein
MCAGDLRGPAVCVSGASGSSGPNLARTCASEAACAGRIEHHAEGFERHGPGSGSSSFSPSTTGDVARRPSISKEHSLTPHLTDVPSARTNSSSRSAKMEGAPISLRKDRVDRAGVDGSRTLRPRPSLPKAHRALDVRQAPGGYVTIGGLANLPALAPIRMPPQCWRSSWPDRGGPGSCRRLCMTAHVPWHVEASRRQKSSTSGVRILVQPDVLDAALGDLLDDAERGALGTSTARRRSVRARGSKRTSCRRRDRAAGEIDRVRSCPFGRPLECQLGNGFGSVLPTTA